MFSYFEFGILLKDVLRFSKKHNVCPKSFDNLTKINKKKNKYQEVKFVISHIKLSNGIQNKEHFIRYYDQNFLQIFISPTFCS